MLSCVQFFVFFLNIKKLEIHNIFQYLNTFISSSTLSDNNYYFLKNASKTLSFQTSFTLSKAHTTDSVSKDDIYHTQVYFSENYTINNIAMLSETYLTLCLENQAVPESYPFVSIDVMQDSIIRNTIVNNFVLTLGSLDFYVNVTRIKRPILEFSNYKAADASDIPVSNVFSKNVDATNSQNTPDNTASFINATDVK